METWVYGLATLAVVGGVGIMLRRCYKQKAAKVNIKKEINKRLRFGGFRQDDSNHPHSTTPNFPNSNGHEEEKSSENKSVLKKGMKFLGKAANSIASKVKITKEEAGHNDDDPAQYHQLD